MVWMDGSVYEGEWENGLRSGMGEMRYFGPENKKYLGEWKNNQQNGNIVIMNSFLCT